MTFRRGAVLIDQYNCGCPNELLGSLLKLARPPAKQVKVFLLFLHAEFNHKCNSWCTSVLLYSLLQLVLPPPAASPGADATPVTEARTAFLCFFGCLTQSACSNAGGAEGSSSRGGRQHRGSRAARRALCIPAHIHALGSGRGAAPRRRPCAGAGRRCTNTPLVSNGWLLFHADRLHKRSTVRQIGPTLMQTDAGTCSSRHCAGLGNTSAGQQHTS